MWHTPIAKPCNMIIILKANVFICPWYYMSQVNSILTKSRFSLRWMETTKPWMVPPLKSKKLHSPHIASPTKVLHSKAPPPRAKKVSPQVSWCCWYPNAHMVLCLPFSMTDIFQFLETILCKILSIINDCMKKV